MNRKRRLRIWRRLRAELKKPFAERKPNNQGMVPCKGSEISTTQFYFPYTPLYTTDLQKYQRAALAAAKIAVQALGERFIDEVLT